MSAEGKMGLRPPGRASKKRPPNGESVRSHVRAAAEAWGLTPRQTEILGRAMEGRHARQIAAELERSEVTVGKHLSAIYRAAGVRDRHELVVRIAAVARPRRTRGADPHDPVAAFCDAIGATTRQREVLAGIVRGQSNKEIAAELGLAEVTVEGHVTSLLARAGVRHRIALVLAALAR